MDKKRQLMSCPFCGHTPNECHSFKKCNNAIFEDSYYVECDYPCCDVNPTTREFKCEEEAMRAWNYDIVCGKDK